MGDCVTQSYCDPDTGKYYWKPDQDVSNELYYGFDWDKWLASELDTLDTVIWTIPDGLIKEAEVISGNKTLVKLSATAVGTYEVSCTITSHEAGATQTNTKTAVLVFI